jgi:hypothetical protein
MCFVSFGVHRRAARLLPTVADGTSHRPAERSESERAEREHREWCVAMIEAAKAGMSVNEELYGSTPKSYSRLGV